jgi:RNA polymerase sigma-70 factor (ECF subfamily)
LKAIVNEGLATAGTSTADAEHRFWLLYSASLPYVYGFLLRRCSRQTAEDLTQEVYVDLVRRVKRGDDPSAFTTAWLMTVARSRLIDHIRAQQRRDRKLALAWSNSRDGGAGAASEARPAEIDAATERALECLSEVERCVLLLHHLDGLPVHDVARAIDRSPRATESLLARARGKFRAAYQEAAHG